MIKTNDRPKRCTAATAAHCHCKTHTPIIQLVANRRSILSRVGQPINRVGFAARNRKIRRFPFREMRFYFGNFHNAPPKEKARATKKERTKKGARCISKECIAIKYTNQILFYRICIFYQFENITSDRDLPLYPVINPSFWKNRGLCFSVKTSYKNEIDESPKRTNGQISIKSRHPRNICSVSLPPYSSTHDPA